MMNSQSQANAQSQNGIDGQAIRWLRLDKVARLTATTPRRTRSILPSWPWSADEPGEGTIDVQFHRPITLRRVRLVFEEREHLRTQEFTIVASLHRGEQHRELVRQQFTFSPGGATQQVEDYVFEVERVASIQIRIIPDIGGGPAVAAMVDLRVAGDAGGISADATPD
jgi:hypothetical protein